MAAAAAAETDDNDVAQAWRDLDEARRLFQEEDRRRSRPPPPVSAAASATSAPAPLPEDVMLRIEKRFVRYALLKSLASDPHRGLHPENVQALRKLKRALLVPKPHECDDRCEWQHRDAGQPIHDPFARLDDGRHDLLASGLVYVCSRSGKAHFCGKGRCGRGLPSAEARYLTCPVSGLVVGEMHADDTYALNKKRRFASDGDSARPREGFFLKLYKQNPAAATAAPRSADEEALERKRAKRGDPADSTENAVPSQPQQQQQQKKRSRRKRTRVVPSELPASLLRNDEVYGESALRRAMDQPSKQLREQSRRVCENIIFWEGTERYYQERLQEAEQKAYRKAEAYFSECALRRVLPSRSLCRTIYWVCQGPLLERVFGLAWLATCSRPETQAYFNEALLRAYALVDGTPMAKAEKRRVQFNRVALGLLMGLAEGISRQVWYHRETRRAKDSLEVASLPEEVRSQYESVVVHHLPAHRALRGLPSDADMRAMGILTQAGYASPMVSQRIVKEYLDSLVSFGLTVEQVQAYSLERYMRPRDLDAGLVMLEPPPLALPTAASQSHRNTR